MIRNALRLIELLVATARVKPIAVIAQAVLVLLAGQAAVCLASEEVPYTYSTHGWPRQLGNHRAVVRVGAEAGDAKAVWAHIPWRRRDVEPEKKNVVVVDLKTNQRIRNVAIMEVNREFGDIVFQPATVPGDYGVYYYPLERATGRQVTMSPWRYMQRRSTADQRWLERNGLVGNFMFLEGRSLADLPRAKVTEIQAREPFDSFYPMEIIATRNELEDLLSLYPSDEFLIFPEDRQFPIRMTEDLPLRWIKRGPSDGFDAVADRNEYYTFQLGVFASRKTLNDLAVKYGDLRSEDGHVIPAASFNCINLGGIEPDGTILTKRIDVQKRSVQALWIGVQIPADAEPGTYKGTLLVGPAAGKKTPFELTVKVTDHLLEDQGVSELWRHARLKWLDSTLGSEDVVTTPYTPLVVEGRTVKATGKEVTFGNNALPINIRTTSGEGEEILASPIRFVVEGDRGPMRFQNATPALAETSATKVVFSSQSKAGNVLVLDTSARMEYDGYCFYQITLRAFRDVQLKDIRLEIPYRKKIATYLMGFASGEGGYRRSEVKWSWKERPWNNRVWIGDVDAGLRCKLRGPAALEESNPITNERGGIPVGWSNEGRGGATVTEDGQIVWVRAYSGPRQMKAGDELDFNFSLLITPVRPRDPQHWCNPVRWSYRHSKLHNSSTYSKLLGAKFHTAFHASRPNPWINYPFERISPMREFIDQANSLGIAPLLYYTISPFGVSNHMAELWAMRSLGDEVLHPRRPEAEPWLLEHLIENFNETWVTNPDGVARPACASLKIQGPSRWQNYHIEGAKWLMENFNIGGFYLDGCSAGRRALQRLRRTMDRARPGSILDLHGGNMITSRSCSFNAYMESLAYVDSCWIGEGFNYGYGPEFWLTELSGIPFGMPNAMLQFGGNPWRGMLYGMTASYIENHNCIADVMWKFWDEFGIQDTRMIGYWDRNCPVKTGREDVLATVYRKEGASLISIASWAEKAESVRLRIDWEALGIAGDKARIHAPPIPGFQNAELFEEPWDIPVAPARGWLLVVDADRGKAIPQRFAPSERVVLRETFSGSSLDDVWRVRQSGGNDASARIDKGELVVTGPSGGLVFVEREMPEDAGAVQCRMHFPMELRRPQKTWNGDYAPGLSVVWPNRSVRLMAATRGWINHFDGVIYEFYREVVMSEDRDDYHLRIWWDDRYVHADISSDGSHWTTVRAMPRGLFEGQPTGIRLGKMDLFRRGSYSNKGGRQEARYDDLLVLGPPQDAP